MQQPPQDALPDPTRQQQQQQQPVENQLKQLVERLRLEKQNDRDFFEKERQAYVEALAEITARLASATVIEPPPPDNTASLSELKTKNLSLSVGLQTQKRMLRAKECENLELVSRVDASERATELLRSEVRALKQERDAAFEDLRAMQAHTGALERMLNEEREKMRAQREWLLVRYDCGEVLASWSSPNQRNGKHDV